jgi:hypothetical protein
MVRDLAAVLEAPGLLARDASGWMGAEVISDERCREWVEGARERLLELDRDPAPLRLWVESAPASPLLGRYFEALAGYWVRHLLGARRMETSVKVRRGRQVVGELDLVFEAGKAELEHWEVSVKYYLCTAAEPRDAARAAAFLGTMTRDRLDKKIERIRSAQLPRAASEEGREALRAVDFGGRAVRTRLLMKGALFYPWADEGAWAGAWRSSPYPSEVSDAHLRGWWAKRLPPGEHWVELERRRWLSPAFLPGAGIGGPGVGDAQTVRVGVASRTLARAEMLERIEAHFGVHRTALMVAAMEQGVDGGWREAHRGLVVHPGWPWRVIE